MPMLPSAAQQFLLEVASSLVSPRVDSHVCDPKDCSGDDLSIRGRGCRHHGCPGPKNDNASGSRRRMTPLSRSDPVLRFVLSRQRFVRWSQARVAPNCVTASPLSWQATASPSLRPRPGAAPETD